MPDLTPDGAALRRAWVDLVRSRRAARGLEPGWTPGYHLDGGTDPRSGRRYRPVWDEAARKARAQDLDPQAVAAFLFSTSPPDQVPDPKQVGNPDVASRFHAHRARVAAAVGPRLTSDQVAWQTTVRRLGVLYPDRGQAFLAAFADSAASPLYRFAAAVVSDRVGEADRARVLAGLAHPALVQFAACPEAYLHYWGEVLTAPVLAHLRAAARAAAGGTRQ